MIVTILSSLIPTIVLLLWRICLTTSGAGLALWKTRCVISPKTTSMLLIMWRKSGFHTAMVWCRQRRAGLLFCPWYTHIGGRAHLIIICVLLRLRVTVIVRLAVRLLLWLR